MEVGRVVAVGFEVEDAKGKRELQLGRKGGWQFGWRRAVKRCDDALSLAVRD